MHLNRKRLCVSFISSSCFTNTVIPQAVSRSNSLIHFGREVKRADIAIMDKDRPMVPYIVVELKSLSCLTESEQLKSYCNATGAPIGVWTNGEQLSYYNRKDPNYFEPITNIPKVSEKLSDIINEKFTYEDLKKIDRISQQKRSLCSLIQKNGR